MPRALRQRDQESSRILSIIRQAEEPLETREIELKLRGSTRVKVLYRLNLLRGEGLVKGKAVGSGKGTWIWWNPHEKKHPYGR